MFFLVIFDLYFVFLVKVVCEFLGWQYVLVICMQEMDVIGGLKKCIRVMMIVQIDVFQEWIRYVYLEKVVVLRFDLLLIKNIEL